MNIEQAERFYKNNEKKYEIEQNIELLEWLKDSINEGYNPIATIEDLQGLINNIDYWYKIKYPERELEKLDGIISVNFKNIESISEYMNFDQLMYRLPRRQYNLIECGYRAKGWGSLNEIYMQVPFKNHDKPSGIIMANHKTGIVNVKTLSLSLNIYIKEELTLDKVLEILINDNRKDIDYSEIKSSVNNHDQDLELRKIILELAALKLLYSNDTTPENGYIRAKLFVKEFNEKIENLQLCTKEIDDILRRNLRSKDKYECLNQMIDKLSEEELANSKQLVKQ